MTLALAGVCVCNKSINKTERRREVNEWVRVVASEVGGSTPFFEKRERRLTNEEVSPKKTSIRGGYS